MKNLLSKNELNMKILHLITTIERGGAELAVLLLAKRQVEMGNEVSIVFLKGQPNLEVDFRDAGVNVVEDWSQICFMKQVFRLYRRQNRFDILHAHLPRSELLAALTIRGVPLVVTRHNSEIFLPDGNRILSLLLAKMVERRASKVVAISQAVLDYLVSTREVSNLNKYCVVHYDYERHNILPERNEWQNIPIFGTISRLEMQKNLDFLLDVCGVLKKRGMSFLCQIMGEGSQKSKLESKSKELGLGNTVQFLPKSSNVFQSLVNWDVFILTSNYEGFGRVLLEACDASIPIVAFSHSAIPEVLGQDHKGLVRDYDANVFADKIAQVLLDNKLKKEIIYMQQNTLTRFLLVNEVTKYLRIYDYISEHSK